MNRDKLLREMENLRRRVAELEARLTSNEVEAKSLRVSESRHRQAVEGSPNAIISMDAIGTVLSWNRASTEITGYSSEEAVGRNWSFLIVEPEPSRFLIGSSLQSLARRSSLRLGA